MTTLAPKLPYSHPFAGGYPRLGGQPLPSDPDAIDYLDRVAAADGAAVEVGVAMAIDAFVKGCKADGIWDAIKASCIMAGARTLTGALVPLVGTAPTPYNFASADYDRSTGLKGDGSTTYLDSNRASDADGRNDRHMSIYVSSAVTDDTVFIGGIDRTTSPNPYVSTSIAWTPNVGTEIHARASSVDRSEATYAGGTTFMGVSRSDSGFQQFRIAGSTQTDASSSQTPTNRNNYVFARNDTDATLDHSDARLAFYSIGSSLDLALLDTRVSTLISAIAAALS